MKKEFEAFAKGYRQGFTDAKQIYDLKENELYVKSGCNCQNVMYCDGACFPEINDSDLK